MWSRQGRRAERSTWRRRNGLDCSIRAVKPMTAPAVERAALVGRDPHRPTLGSALAAQHQVDLDAAIRLVRPGATAGRPGPVAAVDLDSDPARVDTVGAQVVLGGVGPPTGERSRV